MKSKKGFAARLLAIVLAVVLVVGVMPSAAMAEETAPVQTEQPSQTPEPAETPSDTPTEPSAEPTTQPSAEPTTEPTTEPSAEPTTQPSTEPTTEPSAEPTEPSSNVQSDPVGQVRVIVENTTYTDSAAAWSGTLVDALVNIYPESTMMSATVAALNTVSATQTGADSDYITEVNGLSAMDGGSMSGWMGTLNDWFTSEGFGGYTVAAGTLEDGDLIRIMYSLDYGADLGSGWDNNTKTLSALSADTGALSPAFTSDTHAYTLTVPAGTTGVVLTPTAANKNFQVRTSVNGTEYKRTATIPVENGTVISVKCGDPAWPSMNNQSGGTGASVPAETYTITVAFPQAYENMTFNIPANAAMTLGSKVKHYYPYTMATPVSEPTVNADNTVRYEFDLTNGTAYTYEIKLAGKAKYAATFTMSDALLESGITVSASDMSADAGYISRDLNGSKNVSDIYLNLNAKGFLTLENGGTYQLHPLRNWQTVENTTTSTKTPFVEPEYHYTVINESGAASSSVVTVDGSGLITAVGNGTAIVLVTYDAMYEANAGGLFSAIWQENTGVFVVNVGGASAVQTNMTINAAANSANQASKREGDAIDAELDPLYYLSTDSGAEYTFTPEAGSTVTLLRPTLSETAMSYSGGFSSEGVAEANGTYTLTLTEGRNIVKITKGENVSYQVLTAKKVTASITNNTTGGSTFNPGDSVTVVFDTVYHPVQKLAAMYNFRAQMCYTAENDAAVKGGAAQYTFPTTANAQKVTFTIPAGWTGDTYSLESGAIYVSSYGSALGAHRDIDWTNGHSAAFDAQMRTAYMGKLPDISIAVEQNSAPALKNGVNAANARILTGVAYNLDLSEIFEDADGDTLSYTVKADDADAVSADESYSLTPESAGEYTLVFKASDGALESEAYTVTLTVSDPQSVTVTLSGQQENTFLQTPKSVTVTEGTAAAYGYTIDAAVSAGQITALDALVELHKAIYGSDFTPETASEYLAVNAQSGTITKLFGESTYNASFAVNGVSPSDGVLNPAYNAYTGYMVNRAVIENGDSIEFFVMQDSYWADNYTWFEQNGAKVTQLSAAAGDTVSLDLKGYCIGWYGCSTPETIAQSTVGIGGAAVYSADESGTRSEAVDTASAEDGSVILRFNAVGTYYITAAGDTDAPIISPWLKVTVTQRVPAVPSNVKAAAGAYNTINVSWKAAADAQCYEVYRAAAANGAYALIKTTTGHSVSDTNAAVGTRYYYKVRAYRTDNNQKVYGAYSAAVSAVTTLGAPSSVKAVSAGTTSVKISWNAVAGASKYEIYRSESANTGYRAVSTVAGTSLTDSKLIAGKRYYYKVCAASGSVKSTMSAAVSAVPVPSAPSVKAASAGTTSVKITWNAVAGATKYAVYRSGSADSGYEGIATVTGTSYADNPLLTGKRYYYKVRAIALSVKGEESVVAAAAPKPAKPAKPTSLKGVSAASGAYIKLSWSNAKNASGYQVYRSSDGENYTYVGFSASESFKDKTVVKGKKYYYKVRAYTTVRSVTRYGSFCAPIAVRAAK